jgi:putative endopeptidase
MSVCRQRRPSRGVSVPQLHPKTFPLSRPRDSNYVETHALGQLVEPLSSVLHVQVAWGFQHAWFSNVKDGEGDSHNGITFPAAILQKPFFSTEWVAAANFGAIGSIMGHELTHGFDDEGRQYDATGALRDWWTPAVASAFEARAACVADQFDMVHPLPETMVDGTLTLSETLADLGGLQTSLAAFHAARSGDDARAGFFTPDQQFFLAYAQSQCENDRPAHLKDLLTRDAHPPWPARINGAVLNVPEFAAAFACRAGAPLAPAERCSIW